MELLSRRLDRLVELYAESYGVDVSSLVGSGSAGGLAGGLAALGATLTEGFELVADHVGLEVMLEDADAVLTGEGLCDAASFEGKVLGGVAGLAASLGLSAGAVVGELDDGLELPPGFEVASLVAGVGREAALGDPARSVTLATERMLDALLPG